MITEVSLLIVVLLREGESELIGSVLALVVKASKCMKMPPNQCKLPFKNPNPPPYFFLHRPSLNLDMSLTPRTRRRL